MTARLPTEQATDKPNRMERRRLETRSKLMAATLKLLVKKGVEKMTMDDITNTADLGRRTFYYHFSSKEECIVATVANVYKQHGENIAEVEGIDDPALVIAISILVVLDALLEDPVTACLVDHPRLIGLVLVQALGNFVRRDMDEGLAAGRFKAPINSRVLDRMLMWTIVGLLVESQDIEEDRSGLLQDYARTFLMILGLPAKEAKSVAAKARKRVTT